MLSQRYDRNLPVISPEKQRELATVCVAIVGLGGIGGHVAEMCARLGIGRLILIDHDVFEASNLNRQRFATEANLGEAKVVAAKAALQTINSSTRVVAHQVFLQDQADLAYLQEAHVIMDCLDNIVARVLLQEFSCALNIPLIHGTIGEWEGQYAFFLPDQRRMERVYAHGAKTKAVKGANLPSLPPLVAALEVSLLTAYLSGQEDFRPNVLYRFDLRTNESVAIDLN